MEKFHGFKGNIQWFQWKYLMVTSVFLRQKWQWLVLSFGPRRHQLVWKQGRPTGAKSQKRGRKKNRWKGFFRCHSYSTVVSWLLSFPENRSQISGGD